MLFPRVPLVNLGKDLAPPGLSKKSSSEQAAMCEKSKRGANGNVRQNGVGGGGGSVLTKQDLEMIAAYKYKPGTYTYVDNLLTPFWNWAVTLLPLWMAPNLVTFIGLVGTALAAVLLTSYSPQLDGEVPGWCSALFALTLFIYQTLDAIDGKQARRTNSSSPLGQLFDHGCDTVVKVCIRVLPLPLLVLGGGGTRLRVCVPGT